MLYYPFDLTEYFVQTKKYYYFFDGLFILEKRLKKDILEELNIPDSTYRTNRLKVFTKNKNHIHLLEYFNYKVVEGSQALYEKCLVKIFNAVYYRETNELIVLKEELEGYILENNYLKPVFILFKLLIAITITSNYQILLQENKKFLDYLNLFPKDYFTSELYYLSSLILYFCERKVKDAVLKNNFTKFPDLAWIYYSFRGSYEYLHNNDYEAMIYFENSLHCFKNYLNFTRLVAVSNNIAYIHNVHGQYEISLQYLNKVLPYAFYHQNNRQWCSYLIQHYFFANFMLKRYKDIRNFLMIYNLEKDEMDSITLIISIVVAHKLCIKLEELNSSFMEAIKEQEEVFLFYKILHNMIPKRDFRQFFLYSKEYFKKIIEILKLDIVS